MTVQKMDDLEMMFLEHYGVLGMKWGVRRSQAQLDRAAGRKTSGGKANLGSSGSSKKKARLGSKTLKKSSKSKARLGSQDRSNAKRNNNSAKARLGSRSINQLGDRELRELTNRMEMERKYNQISAPGKSKGRQVVDKTLSGMKFFNDVVNTTSNTYKNGKAVVDLAKKLKR